MLSTITATLGLFGALAAAAPVQEKRGTAISITPHDKYSSSVGVLGCKIDTNRVAYWPIFPSCDSVCVKVTSNGRSLHLLQVDQSGGAYDISYDAWNYLNSGKSATEDPETGGGIDAEYERAPMSDCADLIKEPEGKLALSAANSMGFYTGCGMPSWMTLYNILNPTCTYGEDVKCSVDLSVSNQPNCGSSVLGNNNPLSMAVTDIEYSTGKAVAAV